MVATSPVGRRVAPGTRLIAAMTTAFAVRQLISPLLVRGDIAAPACSPPRYYSPAALLPHQLKGHRRDHPRRRHRPDAPLSLETMDPDQRAALR